MFSALQRQIRRFFSVFWQTLDTGRRMVSNLLFLLVVSFVLAAIYLNLPKKIEDRTALLLNFKGALVEQHSASVKSLLTLTSDQNPKGDTQLRDVLQVLDAASHDAKIGSVVLMLDDMESAGLPALREVAMALERFKASGKPVIAWGANFDQRQYFLAAHANEIYMDPMGQVLLEGFGHYQNYYRDALDKLGITVNLMRVGTFKSFAEPYIANGPSPAALEADRTVFDALWHSYTQSVEKARKLNPGSIDQSIESLPQDMAAAKGDTGKIALQLHWIDGLKTRNDLKKLMTEKGAPDKDGTSFRQVSFQDYLSRQVTPRTGNAVGVVIAEGEIHDGEAQPGTIGGLSTAALIHSAREDDHIKAIVLRVNSPGGSAYASELIRRELELTRAAGKPIIVSMGNLAASGGYWITLAADEVIADPDTVTGSIGVFALIPTADRLMAKLGVHTGGVTTTWLADAHNPLRTLDPRFGAVIQSSVEHIYDEFTRRTALARKTTVEKIDAVAQGRIWTGKQALERGLVDRTGSFDDALQSAAQRAQLSPGYRVAYFDEEATGFQRWLKMFNLSPEDFLGRSARLPLTMVGLSPAAGVIADPLVELSSLASGGKNFVTLTHCLCQAP
jgi:protease-4